MSLARRALTVSGWTLASRVLGLVRDRLWAGAMGGSVVLDAFLLAFALPNLLRNLFGEGALSAAFIPRYVQMRERDPAAAERFAGLVLTRLLLGLSALSALGMVGAALVAWFGAGKAALVATMALPQIPYAVLICGCAIMAGTLNGRRHFWVPAAAPVLLNAVMISTVWLSTDTESRVLPYAVLLAGVLQFALHAWALTRTGGLPPPSVKSSPEVTELRRATAPTLMATSVYQVNAWLDGVFASIFVPGAGAVAILYFGNRLLQFPMALIGHGIATVAYPELARAKDGDWQEMGNRLREATRLQAFWLLPAAVGLLVVAEPLVRVIYQTGRFDEESVQRTVMVTRMLALALVPISLSKLLVRAFHARRDQGTPMRISLAMVGLNLALNLVLVRTPLREAGLALATAVSAFVGCACYVVLLRRRGAGMTVELPRLVRPLCAAAVMAIGVELLVRAWPQPAHAGSGIAAVRLLAACALGGALYLAITGTRWMRRRAFAPVAVMPPTSLSE